MAKQLGWYIPEQLVLTIRLADSEPMIWRRVEVHSGLTLHDLHYVIQSVFDWENSHLYQFLVPSGGKLTRRAVADATRFHMLPPDPFLQDDDRNEPADEMLVGRAFTEDCKQIIYEYDFGDSWVHIVKLEKCKRGGDQEHVPICLAGENASPLDDMGGIHGYYQWLGALRDEKNEMHEQAVNCLGEDFDATRFNLEAVNKRLKAAFKAIPKKRKKPKKPRKK